MIAKKKTKNFINNLTVTKAVINTEISLHDLINYKNQSVNETLKLKKDAFKVFGIFV